MDQKKLSTEEIEEIVAGFVEGKYNKPTIDLVREDLEYGLSREQIELYKSKKLKYEQRREMSNAMRQGIPDDVISRFSGGKYTESQISTFVDEYKKGMDPVKLTEILEETQSGYDMKEACKKISEHLSNTTKKPVEEEKEKESEEEETDKQQKETDDGTAVSGQKEASGVSGADFLKSMEMMMAAFTSTMQMQFDRMDRKEEEKQQAVRDKQAEEFFNARISELESSLSNVKRELSESYSVMDNKDKQIKSLQSELEDREKALQNSVSEKEKEIQGLREEMDRMRTVKTQDTSAHTVPAMQNVSFKEPADAIEKNKAAAGMIPNYSTTMVTADGKIIPIQVERMERKSSSGLAALMSKFLPKGSAKTILTRMIEGRYSGEQLAELEFAYSKGLDEAEVKELIEANLPADEMHGIINVVAAAKWDD